MHKDSAPPAWLCTGTEWLHNRWGKQYKDIIRTNPYYKEGFVPYIITPEEGGISGVLQPLEI